ncbi:hypothetical protein GCM10008995_12370 [Halobellus salinus]|uniref:Uncharacterized protein n=1 Tax=Halobellus salinus TaxID=931585 RepID=A0A830E9F6_9EURY|nr:hypothetical protein GCM10008995_12370 [Halobellus salinus]
MLLNTTPGDGARRAETNTAVRYPIRLPLSALRLPLSALRLPLSALRLPLSALRLPLSALRLPLSALRLPLSALRPPPSGVPVPGATVGSTTPIPVVAEVVWARLGSVCTRL